MFLNPRGHLVQMWLNPIAGVVGVGGQMDGNTNCQDVGVTRWTRARRGADAGHN